MQYQDANVLSDAFQVFKAENNAESTELYFPEKLHYMISELQKDGLDHIVSWQPHGRCFRVHKEKQFEKEVLPLWFRQTKFESFQRQLNLYRFRRLTTGRDKGSYYHELFVRGCQSLARKIVRNSNKSVDRRRKTGFEPAEPDLYAMPPIPAVGSAPNSHIATYRDNRIAASMVSPSPTPTPSSVFLPHLGACENLSPPRWGECHFPVSKAYDLFSSATPAACLSSRKASQTLAMGVSTTANTYGRSNYSSRGWTSTATPPTATSPTPPLSGIATLLQEHPSFPPAFHPPMLSSSFPMLSVSRQYHGEHAEQRLTFEREKIWSVEHQLGHLQTKRELLLEHPGMQRPVSDDAVSFLLHQEQARRQQSNKSLHPRASQPQMGAPGNNHVSPLTHHPYGISGGQEKYQIDRLATQHQLAEEDASGSSISKQVDVDNRCATTTRLTSTHKSF